jgi:NADPH:quinone reductase-like Zn-dependent oxidoreductase
MQAIRYDRYGSPDALHLAQVAVPEPAQGEVRVHVHACGVNPWDVDLLRGRPFVTRIAALRKPQYPILGADIAGTVDVVGSGVTGLQPGDAVFGDISGVRWGGFAQYAIARPDVVARIPAGMSYEQAASLPQAGILALDSLRYGGEAHPGPKVLFNGAGGGVGTIGIQLAKAMGAEVTAVDKAEKLDALRALGADHVLDYRQTDFTRSEQTYDRIVDVVANRSVAAYRRALRPEGVFVFVGGSMSAALRVMLRGKWISRTSRQRIGLLMHKPSTETLQALGERYEAGELAPVIDTVYPLSETPEAFRRLEAGDVLGKVVISLNQYT